jgi:hypothetical protein
MTNLKGKLSKHVYENRGEQGSLIRSDKDREKIIGNLTKDMEKTEYDPKKFGCMNMNIWGHDVEWDGNKWKCKNCSEEGEI